MKGVILAAGKGERLYPLSDNYPKTLLPICNKAVIVYQLELMKGLGISDVVIVIGHYGYKIVEQLGNGSRFGLNIDYIEQKKPLGVAHAVGLVEPKIKDSFLLFLGDIFFVSKEFGKFVETFRAGGVNCLLAAKVEHDKERIKKNFAIIADDEGRVRRVIEKPHYAGSDLKGCGLYIFDLHLFDAIRRTPKTAMRDEYELADAIQILIEDGFAVKVMPVIEDDLNLTSIEDLFEINMMELKNQGRLRLIGENAVVKNIKKVVNSVIGANAVIGKDVEIVNSVVFPGVDLNGFSSSRITNSIVTAGGVYKIDPDGGGMR